MMASIERNLKDAGCSEEFVQNFEAARSDDERLRQLARYRTELRSEIHAEQHKLDCLDYLIFKIKEESR